MVRNSRTAIDELKSSMIGVLASVIVSPVLAGLAVAIGVPVLLFYVYGVVPVSLCRAGCGEGTKFEFDEEEENGSRNHDAASVDAVSRIGATSIGEVSLSVASGSHLGVSSQHSAYGATNPSTTALAGSITGHRLEVQADVSTSETASAVTCVSEKSGNTLNDTASTKALAGSILSYKQQAESSAFSEDGASERVRFDNTVSFVIDSKKDSCDFLYSIPSDQDTAADKASLGSGRSFRSSERSFRDDFDSTSVSSAHKRINFGKLIPKLSSSQHRNLSVDSTTGSYNIPENVSLEQELEQEELPTGQHVVSSGSSSAVTAPLRNATQSQTTFLTGGTSSVQQKTQSGSLDPSPDFAVRHAGLGAKSSIVPIESSSSSCSSNEAINRAILVEKSALSTFNAGVCAVSYTEAAQNQRNESKPMESFASPPLSTSSLSEHSTQDQQPIGPPKSRTHILRNLFFSLPNTSESSAPTEATVECGHISTTGARTRTTSIPLTSPLSPSSSSTSSASSTTHTGPSSSKTLP
uniref:Uncharacterized protein n=1 Tax=Anopheles minimus TaxID=112268 RepID=A0A182W3M4_9DIPT